MPLSKERNKDRMRTLRALQARGIQLEGGIIRLHAKKETAVVQPVPLYNPSVHKPGDTVRIIKGNTEITLTIPNLDADGQPIPEDV